MIENARRQVILVVLVALASLVFILKEPFRYGLDLSGGTQLVYNLDIEGAQRLGKLPEEADPETVMAETLAIIADRIDPTGVLDAVIQKRGDRDFLIELPQVNKTEAEIIKSQIQNLGKLEMRMLADPDYNENGVTFDLPEERKRLEAWLEATDPDGVTNRARLAVDVEHISQFNGLSVANGGRKDQENLLWYPAKVGPSYKANAEGQWDSPLSSVPDLNVVPVFTDAELSAGTPENWDEKQKPFLVELVPINLAERHFEGKDMDASGVRQGNDPNTGTPCVFYALNADNAGPYADWSQKHKGKNSAIILNGVVRSAPEFISRIYGSGIITGGFTEREAADLAKVIKTGSLQVKPSLISDVSIGATLGARQIELGQVSILAGGVLVLFFILSYYRLAGIVAFCGIALNVFLILGAVQFIRATITLPGIAGLVLTMGMAVDANILIYERIREELGKGKDLIRAVRAGFERAMVTILDANLTTFIAGVVLYNVGVGPVRGFAVTLMIGILTTLFTAFFVSRLVFHVLLTRNILKDFQVAGWFSNLSFDFVAIGRRACIVSFFVAIGGLLYTLSVPNDRKLGLDFTGGASLELALKEPQTLIELRDRLAANPDFNAQFPSPLINTLGETDENNRTNQFLVKLKLSNEVSARVDREKRDAADQGVAFEPHYKGELRETLRDVLVQDAFSKIETVDDPTSALNLAELEVHFTRPVSIEQADAKLKLGVGRDAEAIAVDASATTDTDALLLTFHVQDGVSNTDIINKVIKAYKDLEDVDGQKIVLSDPIPSAEDIGPRMVGQLRTAAIGAMVISLFLIVMYIRVRFHEYKYGFAAVAALTHDVLITLAFVVFFNSIGFVSAEIDLAMIAAFLTIIGYSINDTIVIFDRIRENVTEEERLGDKKETFGALINRSINQTLSRTILTSTTTLFVVLAQFVVNRGSGSALEGFSFALLIGIVSGTYSTMFIASPLVLWLRNREADSGDAGQVTVGSTENRKITVESPA